MSERIGVCVSLLLALRLLRLLAVHALQPLATLPRRLRALRVSLPVAGRTLGPVAVRAFVLVTARSLVPLAVRRLPPSARAVRLLAMCGLVLLGTRPALAHSVGVSRGDYRVAGTTVEVDLVFAQPELAATLVGLDADRDGALSADELARARELLTRTIVHGLEIRSASGPCPGSLVRAELTEADGLAVRALYRCGDEVAGLSLRLGFFDALSLGHRHLVTAYAGMAPRAAETIRAVVYEARPEAALPVAGPDAGATESPRPSPRAPAAVALPFFGLGLEHILTGYDHLVFLLALILVGGSLRSLLVVVTAFTLAHSLTLSLAVLGVWAPSPRLIEPAIALSIAYVGIENWFVRDAARRWMITFPFGLVHGFGFAGALQEVGLPSAQVPVALAAFNVGVEAGQVAVLLLFLPGVLWLGRRQWFAGSGLRVVSAAITVAGLCWFVSRVA
jgi:hypothetical protein